MPSELTTLIDIIAALASDAEQKATAESILEDDEILQNVSDAYSSLPLAQVAQLHSIYKLCPNTTVLAVATRVILFILQMNPTKSGNLIQSGIVEIICDIAVPVLMAPAGKGQVLGKESLQLIAQVIECGSGKRIIDHTIFKLLVGIIEMENDFNIDYFMLALDCLKRLTKFDSLRGFVQSNAFEALWTIIEDITTNEWDDDLCNYDLKIDILKYAFEILHHLIVEKAAVKTLLCQKGIINLFKAAYDMIENKYFLLAFYAELHPLPDSDLAEEALAVLPTVFTTIKKTESEFLLNCGLAVIRNCTLYPKIPVWISTEIHWFLELLLKDNTVIQEHCLVIIQNLSLADSHLFSSHYRTMDLIKFCLTTILNKASNDLVLPSLGIICNAARNDSLAQKICSIGDPTLFPRLFDLSKEHQGEEIEFAAVSCIRNLLIDKPACKEVAETMLSVILLDLHSTKVTAKTPKFEVIRNLFLQSQQAFRAIFNEPAFVFELIDGLKKNDNDLCRASLDMIEFLMTKESMSYTQALTDSGICSAIAIPLANNSLDRSIYERLQKLHVQIQAFKDKTMIPNNPWSSISQGWQLSDQIFGREKQSHGHSTKPKIKSKKPKAAKPKNRTKN